ncbi:oxidoreductase [Flavobacterium magnum]|uniref:Oxidoreductase n=1 Tax=Flavobacterium magnum TaxID=2162713 RepID=A0A2S0RIV5_9FLAO|nr:oxidoreductase [Flavobacterium magnum]AWA31469.1 oxidoreductase [Flavobacterium magnum]
MKKQILIILIASLLIYCKKNTPKVASPEKAAQGFFASATVDTVFADSISIRAVVFDGNNMWYAANGGKYGFYDIEKKKMFNGHIALDTITPEFRSIAKTKEHVFILNAGSPALLYRISKDGRQVKLVYHEDDSKAFYDSMQFFNDLEGIAMGDPTGKCLSVIVTRDGGNSWTKLPCDKLPAISEGEAAFAASNTNLIIKGKHAWMVSGGKKARLFRSTDKGKNWEVYNTPIVQGKSMTGIFTADFYDEKNGFIAGGDYESPTQTISNKAVTVDGGKTWEPVAEGQGFGYASCVQYVPHGDARQLVCVGASGLQYSADSGKNWTQLLKDKELYTIRFQNDSVAFAAGKNKIVRVRFNRQPAPAQHY